ncbi:MAG: Type prenyl endopeptidase Rce1-like [Candidatus Parcubacteria bacterium]|jgi:membrane protease YdiL (CAAX protease family)
MVTPAENVFIFVASIVLLISAVSVKNIDWEKFGLKPKSLFDGWWQVLLFNAIIFSLIQLVIVNKFIELPDWIVDVDPLLPLLAIVFLQEVIFRGIAISWLERFGRQKALWISVAIFVLFHLLAPYTWSSAGLMFAGLTLVGGYFWGWHYLKFRNIYLLTISHLMVNLSFNFMLINLFA